MTRYLFDVDIAVPALFQRGDYVKFGGTTYRVLASVDGWIAVSTLRWWERARRWLKVRVRRLFERGAQAVELVSGDQPGKQVTRGRNQSGRSVWTSADQSGKS